MYFYHLHLFKELLKFNMISLLTHWSLGVSDLTDLTLSNAKLFYLSTGAHYIVFYMYM